MYLTFPPSDDVTAYLEYSDGMTVVFTASTGEAPGTNRLEVAAERGKVVIENDQLSFSRNEVPMSEFSRTDPGRFSTPPVWEIKIPIGLELTIRGREEIWRSVGDYYLLTEPGSLFELFAIWKRQSQLEPTIS